MFDGAMVGVGSHMWMSAAAQVALANWQPHEGQGSADWTLLKGLIAYARQRVPDGDFRVGDMERLPYEDEQFDAVFAANSVQFSENPVATVREFARVCRPQGRIVAGSVWFTSTG